jgi:uncharacterized protein (DUF1697 family)
MPAVICMLRAVNVGGHNKIKMDELRDLCVSLKLRSPQTYVQSGNVVFGTDAADLAALAQRIQQAIEKKCGFRPDVILRTSAELRGAIARSPFASRDGIEPGKLLVTFLAGEPSAEARAKVLAIETDPEELHIDGRELYTYFPNGMGRPKLSWPKVERALATPGTGRNWNTVTKLLEMVESLEASSSPTPASRRAAR